MREYEVTEEFSYVETYKESIPKGVKGNARKYGDGKVKLEFDDLRNPLRLSEKLIFELTKEDEGKVKLTQKRN